MPCGRHTPNTGKPAELAQDGQPQLTMKICSYGYVRFVPVVISR